MDFEAFPVDTINTSQTKAVKTHIHKPCSFGLTVICQDVDKHYFKPFTYVGEDCVEVLIKKLKEIQTNNFDILNTEIPIGMTEK